MRINTNITALNTFNSYTSANNKIASSVAKLSSGYAINSAADNAAGLAISEKMRAQIRGLDKASSNSQTAISLAQTAEGSLSSSGEILQRMREISVQSSSDTNQDNIDRDALQAEFSQLNGELDEIAQDSTFNNQHLLNGNLATKTTSSGAATALSGSGMSVSFGNANAGIYGFGVKVVTTANAVAGEAADKMVISGSTVNSYFSGVDADPAKTKINSTATSALLNGNYKITDATVNTTDGSITVTAQGDNNQTFHATLSKSDCEGTLNSSKDYTLNFGADAFQITFTKASCLIDSDVSADDAKRTDLANAFKGTEFTVSGGVDAKAAEKAVYATMTGASDVKLKAGADSVTFDNGVTVGYNKLTAANLDTTLNYTKAVTDKTGTATASASGAGTFATTDAIELNTFVTGAQVAKGAGTVYKFSIGGKDYSYTQKATDTTQAAVVTGIAAAMNADKVIVNNTSAAGTITLDATASGTQITLADAKVGDNVAGFDFDDLDWTGSSGSEAYNFESVFGKATAGVSTSTVEAKSTANSGLTIQVGSNTGDEMDIDIERADAEFLGVKGLDVSTQQSASKAVDAVNKAINQVSSQRAYLGAVQNRLGYKINNLTTSSQNLNSAESSIRDVDMASEMTKFTNAQILSQASTAMLAQANSLPQNVLSLLK